MVLVNLTEKAMPPKRNNVENGDGPQSKSLKNDERQSETAKSEDRPPRTEQDGHILMSIGEVMAANNTKYRIQEALGQGTFGKVVKVLDLKDSENYALKIIKNEKRFRTSAKLEVNVLDFLKKMDPEGKFLSIQLLSHFDYFGHACMVFPLFGLSLANILDIEGPPIPMADARYIAYQARFVLFSYNHMFYSVQFLHDHGLTHTDLKPENFVFTDVEIRSKKDLHNSSIRLIDFGSATFDHEHHQRVVSTRHYRAPEIILDMGWNQYCDVWSLGCILFELYAPGGTIMFYTSDDSEHLAMMQKILGPFPYRMVGTKKGITTKYFTEGKLVESKSIDQKRVDACKPLMDYIDAKTEEEQEEADELFDLIEFMLRHKAEERINVASALKHPYFERIPTEERDRIKNGNTTAE